MRTRLLPLLLLLSLMAVPMFADDVYLINGRKFEGVIAETTDSQVHIQMQGGTLSLPKSQVLRVDTGDSSLAEYLRRKETLTKNPGARAADWLELARWAQAKELQQATRESALAAATLDPNLSGLGPILRGYGYVLDDQVDRWIPYAESMRRRGFVLSNGQWITREEHAANVRAYEEENARRRAQREEQARAARADRLAALAELTVVRDLARPAYPPAYPQSIFPGPYYGGVPVVVLPGYWGGANHPREKPSPYSLTHVPGSLIPGNSVPYVPSGSN
jgi:hypothetical protein